MRLRFLPTQWRRILAGLAAVCLLAVLGFVAKFLWQMHGLEDRVGEIPYQDDRSLVLHKTGPGGVSYTVDYARATFRLDLASSGKNGERLFPTYAAALKFAAEAGLPSMPSVQMIHGKCKQFDDDLCATLEQAVQTGSEQIPGKSPALHRLAQKLSEARNAATDQLRPAVDQAVLYVATAVELGGGSAPLDPAQTAEVTARKATFIQKPVLATPIGFWAENETLRQTFLQDRYLMQGLKPAENAGACIALARVISDDPELARAFAFFRELDARLTNPPVYVPQDIPGAPPAHALSFQEVAGAFPPGASLTDLLAPAQIAQTRAKLATSFGADAGFALISYAGSPEYSPLLKAARDGKIDGANTSLKVIIDAVRDGKLSLKPVPGSGWYDYQWYALETLLVPERAGETAKLKLTDAYKKRLEKAFQSGLAKNRETHIKQLPQIMKSMGGLAPPLEIHPDFSVEPTITVYLRTARAYRFLHTALTTVMGPETLRSQRRTSPGNPDHRDLGDELNRMALLCYGIHAIVSVELGLLPSYLPDEISPPELEEAKQIASQWLANAAADPDLGRDSRIAAPITVDNYGNVDFWATGGIRLQRVKYEFQRGPRVGPEVTPVLVPGYYYLPTDVTLEFKRSGVLTRAEFRRLCDSCTDEASLRKLLGVRDSSATPGLSPEVWKGVILLLAGLVLFLARKTRGVPSKRSIRIALALLTLLFTGWMARLYFDESYRVKFLIRHVARRNIMMAMNYRDHYFSHQSDIIGDQERSLAVLRGLVELLRDADPQTRYLAVSYIESLRLENLSEVAGAEENLRDLAGDPNPVVAAYAFDLLGMFPDQRNVEFLRMKLKDDALDEYDRIAIVYGLARTSNPQGMEDIMACARHSSGGLRNAAISQLGSYDNPDCLALIEEMLQSADFYSCRSALSAWNRFNSRSPQNELSAQMDPLLLAAVTKTEFPSEDRKRFASGIHDVPMRRLAYENLLLSPGSPGWRSVANFQMEIVSELCGLEPGSALSIPVLEKALHDPQTDPGLQIEIVKALKRFKPTSPSGPSD